MHNWKITYLSLLPIIVPVTTSIIGISSINTKDGWVVRAIGHSAIGFAVGILYPISFPILAYQMLTQRNHWCIK